MRKQISPKRETGYLIWVLKQLTEEATQNTEGGPFGAGAGFPKHEPAPAPGKGSSAPAPAHPLLTAFAFTVVMLEERKLPSAPE